MRKLTTIIIGLAIVITPIGTAEARHADGLEGLVLGSGVGAIIGHVINRGPEGVLVGSVIGGTLGMLIDIGSDRDQLVVVNPSYRPGSAYIYGNNWNRRHDRWEHGKHRRHDRRWQRGRHHRRR